jgi:aspartate oxidase
MRTDNPARITGDGYALALKAGLPLVDMEFVQFYPLGFDEPRFPCWMVRLPILDMAKLTDRNGREFLKEKMREWHFATGQEISLYARDCSARAIQEELAAGGEVLLHLEDIERQRWKEWDLRKVASCFPPGIDPADYGPVHVSPLEHYFCGGIAIDENASTSIEGLFACGEVTGGVDGASRMGGNALTNVATFAIKAGKAAAAVPGTAPAFAGKAEKECRLFSKGTVEPSSLAWRIRALNQETLGPIRDEKGLKRAVSELEKISGQVREMRAETRRELLLAFEVEGLLLTSRAVAQAALAREESRGVHYRTDFPHENPDLERSRYVKLEQGAFVTGFAGENK